MKKVLIEIDTNWEDTHLINAIGHSLSKGNIIGEIKEIKVLNYR